VNLPKERQLYHLQKEVGHYGVFNGSRFRRDIAPAIAGFIERCAVYADKAVAASRPALRAVR
jgi:poly(3-hydroxybutyrate) depolymerase